jgi:hypothetical protein
MDLESESGWRRCWTLGFPHACGCATNSGDFFDVMNIYMDEAGPFITPRGSRRYSLVLALIIPSAAQSALFYEFLRLGDAWPWQALEVKGSKLDERQTAQVMERLAVHGAIAEYYAIDMAIHPGDVISEFKSAKLRQLPKTSHPIMPKQLSSDSTRMLTQSAPCKPSLRTAFLSIHLILDMLDVAINYYAQRRSNEQGRFAWTIDRKDRTATEMEKLWSTLILPIGESRSWQHPYAEMGGL